MCGVAMMHAFCRVGCDGHAAVAEVGQVPANVSSSFLGTLPVMLALSLNLAEIPLEYFGDSCSCAYGAAATLKTL